LRSAVAEWVREKLRAPEGWQVYAFRRFSFRGYDKVAAERALICLTHNLLQLFRVRTCPQPA